MPPRLAKFAMVSLGGWLLALALSACGGAVGSGSGPKRLEIVQPTGASADTLVAYQCLRSSLAAVLHFSDGSSGNFTNRVVWSSSNPGTVRIANENEEPVTGTSGRLFYPAGTLTPGATGNAVITAEYQGLTAQAQVSVHPLGNLTIKQIIQGNPVTPANGAFTLGAGTTQRLQLTALLDNVESDITKLATWSFELPNDSVATVDSASATVTANQAGGPLQLNAGFDACPDPRLQTSVQVSVADIRGISIQPEFAGNPALIVGNTEKFNVIADLGNGVAQDLSDQAGTQLSSSATDLLQFGATGQGNIAFALNAGGPIQIFASFTGNGIRYDATSLVTSTMTATLDTISISPRNAEVTAGSLTPAQFRAYGSYNSGSITQEITRQVIWSSSDTNTATISNSPQTAGQALGTAAASSGDRLVTITAADSNATINNNDQALLTVHAP
jgi:hypothetical protein